MKFREVASREHSTEWVLNLTHPAGVLNIFFVLGVAFAEKDVTELQNRTCKIPPISLNPPPA